MKDIVIGDVVMYNGSLYPHLKGIVGVVSDEVTVYGERYLELKLDNEISIDGKKMKEFVAKEANVERM